MWFAVFANDDFLGALIRAPYDGTTIESEALFFVFLRMSVEDT